MFVQLPVDLLPELTGFSGQTVILAALLQRQAAIQGWPVVRLPVALLNLCHLNRTAVSRALRQLETAGLIRVHRHPGRRSTVTVLWQHGLPS
jgi:DNA-binding MarR family transcriptional regulator